MIDSNISHCPARRLYAEFRSLRAWETLQANPRPKAVSVSDSNGYTSTLLTRDREISLNCLLKTALPPAGVLVYWTALDIWMDLPLVHILAARTTIVDFVMTEDEAEEAVVEQSRSVKPPDVSW